MSRVSRHFGVRQLTISCLRSRAFGRVRLMTDGQGRHVSSPLCEIDKSHRDILLKPKGAQRRLELQGTSGLTDMPAKLAQCYVQHGVSLFCHGGGDGEGTAESGTGSLSGENDADWSSDAG
ncbi:hypothetical protein AAFF_G00222510 [Aldrovandia affinis]|uniref:Uncharacterized protein n=1 Tax=Aldrovandia affinis TaxID=143900 RepID=A0AAD7RFP1_9TELE|nr:hypothetical protein AAFF_G00222510 [Aldrovandia affinis]